MITILDDVSKASSYLIDKSNIMLKRTDGRRLEESEKGKPVMMHDAIVDDMRREVGDPSRPEPAVVEDGG